MKGESGIDKLGCMHMIFCRDGGPVGGSVRGKLILAIAIWMGIDRIIVPVGCLFLHHFLLNYSGDGILPQQYRIDVLSIRTERSQRVPVIIQTSRYRLDVATVDFSLVTCVRKMWKDGWLVPGICSAC